MRNPLVPLPKPPPSSPSSKQAVSDLGFGEFRSQAAMLPDRWAYYVRAGAVEDYMTAPPSPLPLPVPPPLARNRSSSSSGQGQGRGTPPGPPALRVASEVLSAASSCEDAALTLEEALQALLKRLQGSSRPQTGSVSQAADSPAACAEREEAVAELERLMDWSSGSGGPPAPWANLERQSYALFAADAVAKAAGECPARLVR